ncbi:MAG: hypothetical protein KDD61_02400 [Bdellovibrionales bacterium]|nr:hypothetical protein [Bdellovibrionales bacterium]
MRKFEWLGLFTVVFVVLVPSFQNCGSDFQATESSQTQIASNNETSGNSENDSQNEPDSSENPVPQPSPVVTDACSMPGVPITEDEVDESFVWRPTLDSQGVVRCGSIEKLPLLKWVGLHSSYASGQQIEDVHSEAGWEWSRNVIGNSKRGYAHISAPTFSGAALDLGHDQIFMPWVGGHHGSSYNAAFGFHIPTLKFFVAGIPDTGAASSVNKWNPDYRNNFSTYPNDPQNGYPAPRGRPDAILPGNFPTSMHHYNGLWVDPNRRTVNQFREMHWEMTLPDSANPGQFKYHDWIQNGEIRDTSIYNQLFWNEYLGESGMVVGLVTRFPNDVSGALINIDPSIQPDVGPWEFKEIDSKLGLNISAGIQSVRVDRNKGSYLYFFANVGNDDYGDSYAVYDMKLNKVIKKSTAVIHPMYYKHGTGTVEAHNNSPAVYIPELDRVLRRFTKYHPDPKSNWAMFNPETGGNEVYVPEGNVPARDFYMGRRYFYYPKWKSVIAVSGDYNNPSNSATCVWVLRTGS